MTKINPILMTCIGAAATVASTANAALYYSTNFATGYNNGALVGQNGWLQSGTAATNPLQVSNGNAIIGTSGQDAYAAFTTSAPATAGTSLYVAVNFRISAAQAAGDYFFHVSEPVGTTSNFFARLFARSSGAGFVLGLTPTSGTASYGTTVLNYNQNYTAVIAIDFTAGASNDALSLFVDPNSDNRGDLTAYFSTAFSGTLVEPAQISAVNLRQGAAANAPSVAVSTIAAGDSLASVGVVPAPGAVALLGLAGLRGSRRRR